jgi:regulator of sigma E protease
MIYSILYLLLAALALGVLIFIHELGHYWVARKEGMKVEAFSIGFGKPFLVWEKDGVKWQLCWIPFGGYVRIAGMEKKGSLEPYQIPDGFYGKRPLSRIKVALAGPIVNIVFALLLFAVIWLTGGRDKPFSEYTHLIGWVEPSSNLYEIGVRPGDEIESFGNKPFEGFNQLIYAAFLEKETQKISGYEINYATGEKRPFSYLLDMGQDLKGLDRVTMTVGILNPASFLIYEKYPDGKPNPLPEGSPMQGSGIEYNDRILWVDGELIFSKRQLISVINQPRVLVTVKRGSQVFLSRIPRLKIADLRLSGPERAELQDWEFEAGLKDKVQELYFIPYNLTPDCRVENAISYIDEDASEKRQFETTRSKLEIPLLRGDQILAVDGYKILNGYELLRAIQVRHVQMIVQRGMKYPSISWKAADNKFMAGVAFEDLQKLSQSIGTENRLQSIGDLHLLAPIQPKPLSEFPLSESIKERLASEFIAQKKQIEQMDNPQERALALRLLEENQKKLMLGIVLQDRQVIYNPSPFKMFVGVFDETWRTLRALVTGYLSPKYMSGPVGIVQAIHYGWMLGIKEALFWIAVISLNLGIINLLPVPVLDGGHICFAVIESITKKPIKAKTMERLVIPFIVLLVLFFIYLTYQDILRLLSRFF